MNMVQVIEACDRPRSIGCKPCPFCGTDPLLPAEHRWGKNREWSYFAVGCENEDCPIEPRATGNTMEEAMARWNQRL